MTVEVSCSGEAMGRGSSVLVDVGEVDVVTVSLGFDRVFRALKSMAGLGGTGGGGRVGRNARLLSDSMTGAG
jgi:hypothetical protein